MIMADKKGYRPATRTALLEFTGTEYAGAWVRCRLSLPLKKVLELQGFQETDIRAAIELFGRDILMEWNLEGEDGQPLPATVEGLLEMDMAFVQCVIEQWVSAVAQPPTPLAVPSGNGSMSGGPSAPTAESSLALGNLSKPS